MQSKCNEYKRQQSEQYMWKTVDRWIWYSLCDHRKVKLKNGRPTNGLALSTQCDYSISTLFCLFDFHPNLNIHCFQLPILLHSVFTRSLTAALQSRNCIHLPNLSNLCSDCCQSLTFTAKRIWQTRKKHNQSQKSHCSLETVRKKTKAEERCFFSFIIFLIFTTGPIRPILQIPPISCPLLLP